MSLFVDGEHQMQNEDLEISPLSSQALNWRGGFENRARFMGEFKNVHS